MYDKHTSKTNPSSHPRQQDAIEETGEPSGFRAPTWHIDAEFERCRTALERESTRTLARYCTNVFVRGEARRGDMVLDLARDVLRSRGASA